MRPGSGAQKVATLDAVAELIPAEIPVHLALPAKTVVLERMKLPSIDRAELAGMVDLQLEKTLPYSPDEVSSDFEVISATESDSVVLAIAVSNDQLDALCAPLHTAERVPEKVTLFAMHVAAGLPPDALTLALYSEQEKLVVLIGDRGKLVFVETVAVEKASDVLIELPQMLLSAELDGVSTAFTAIRVDQDCAALRPELEKLFHVTAEIIALDHALPEPRANLLPAAWRQERTAGERRDRLKSQLITGAAIYLALIVMAFGYLIWLRSRANAIEAQVRAGQPQIDFIQTRLARWNALAPAIDPARYTVEILNQIEQSRPGEGVRFTQFDQSRDQFQIEIEAPTANLAIEFGEQIKNNAQLKAFTFQLSPPTILPNEHAQMRIAGKL